MRDTTEEDEMQITNSVLLLVACLLSHMASEPGVAEAREKRKKTATRPKRETGFRVVLSRINI